MIYDIHHALEKLYPDGAGYVQEGNAYSGLKWVDKRPKPTEKEINDKIAELNAAEPIRLLREERNRRIAETDWMSFSDSPTMTDEWKTYRQALRDLPSSASPNLDEQGNLNNVTWPTKPT